MICKSVAFNNKLIFVGTYDGIFLVFCCKAALHALLEFNRTPVIHNIINNVCLFFVFGLKILKKYIYRGSQEKKKLYKVLKFAIHDDYLFITL